jgi:hypothetical protein
MIRKLTFILFISCFYTLIARSQPFIRASDLFARSDTKSRSGKLNIIQDPALDTLMSRYILCYKNREEKNGPGMDGFRIQIYSSSNRNAKDESNKINAEFLSKFPESKYPDLKSYAQFAQPAYYKIRVGDFRTRTEATRLFLIISKVFPDAYIVPDIINFPDLNTK